MMRTVLLPNIQAQTAYKPHKTIHPKESNISIYNMYSVCVTSPPGHRHRLSTSHAASDSKKYLVTFEQHCKKVASGRVSEQ